MPSQYRSQCDDIAKQLIYSEVGQKVNLVFGGGRRNFIMESEGGLRQDENLIQAWKKMKKEQGVNFNILKGKQSFNAHIH